METKLIFLTLKLACVLLSASVYAQQTTPTDKKPWPSNLRNNSQAKVTLVPSEDGKFIYRSTSYQFISDSKINLPQMRILATAAESVKFAVQRIPLDLYHPLKIKKDGEQPLNNIYLYEDVDAYDKATGIENSAGFYSSDTGSILLRTDKFFSDQKPNYQLLVHELTHLYMHGLSGKSKPWFSEGNAEYFAASFYSTGSYNFSSTHSNISKRTRTFIPDTTKQISILPIKDFIAMDNKQWIAHFNQIDPEQRYNQYMQANILIHYFYHLMPDGKNRMEQYLTDLTSADRETIKLAQAKLFQDIALTKLESDLTKYWKNKGLNLNFQQAE